MNKLFIILVSTFYFRLALSYINTKQHGVALVFGACAVANLGLLFI